MIKELIKKPSVKSILVCFSLITLAISTLFTSANYMGNSSIKIISPLNEVDSIQQLIIDQSLTKSTLKTNTLKRQYLICSKIKTYYENISIAYYKYYFAFSLCSIVFTTLVTVGIFLISNKGWKNSDLVLKTFFLTTIVLSSIFYFLSNVMNNKENLNNSTDKIIKLEKIQLDILKVANKIDQLDTLQIDTLIETHYNQISSNLEFITKIDNKQLNEHFLSIMNKNEGLITP